MVLPCIGLYNINNLAEISFAKKLCSTFYMYSRGTIETGDHMIEFSKLASVNFDSSFQVTWEKCALKDWQRVLPLAALSLGRREVGANVSGIASLSHSNS